MLVIFNHGLCLQLDGPWTIVCATQVPTHCCVDLQPIEKLVFIMSCVREEGGNYWWLRRGRRERWDASCKSLEPKL